ncbi:MAG: type II toxin-antitoxin system VapB family antitoxin [Candidatus Kapabacteria bacterium]|nr:type II toxin-antitoxin system VapB family antitoxin [Ignavibacteriota bacterium]MCW5885016.1 type II toxin-antitoxin system VapB family antitoxin [Candidatus Kapabacteria bacterium]
MRKALLLSGYEDKRIVLDESIRLFIAFQAQNKIAKLRGNISWEGDLETLRSNNDNG